MPLFSNLSLWKQIPGFRWLGSMFVIVILVVLFTHSLRFGVYETYKTAAQKILQYQDPYPRNTEAFHSGYKYSPLFAVLFSPFKFLPFPIGSFLWRLLNMTTFLTGLTILLTRIYRNPNSLNRLLVRPWQVLILLLLTYSPFIISLKVAQANSLVCGMILFSLAFYFSGKEVFAGICLALASNFKVFPLAFAMLLLLDFRWKYWCAFWGMTVVSFIIPALFLGWEWNEDLHRLWFRALTTDFDTSDKLSLWKFLQHNFGLYSQNLYRGFVILNVVFICAVYRPAASALKENGLKQLVPLCALFVLLFNHRTETELFVLVNPVYVLLFLKVLEERIQGRKGIKEIVVLIAGHFFITLVHSDIVPDFLTEWVEKFKIRVFGALILYGYFIWEAVKKCQK